MQRTIAATPLVALAVVSQIGCMPPEPARAPANELYARASLDLDCPMPWLRVIDVDERVKGVDGCGRRAVYVELCQEATASCVWWNDTGPSFVVAQTSMPAVETPPPRAPSPSPSAPPASGQPEPPTRWR
jgi:hypothetical protein